MTTNKSECQYEVLGPWAEADPIPMHGLNAPRLTDLNGKKIGLFHNTKRAGKPILTVLERKLKERYPQAEFSWYNTTTMSAAELDPQNISKFEAFVNGVDTVVLTFSVWGSWTQYSGCDT